LTSSGLGASFLRILNLRLSGFFMEKTALKAAVVTNPEGVALHTCKNPEK